MSFRTTIALIVILLGLAAYVYWVERPAVEQEAKKKTLFDIKADQVSDVTLTYSDREIVLRKVGDEWRLVKPLESAADTTTVKNLVNAIAELEIKKELTEPSADLAEYGLDKPFVTVTVKLGDQEQPAIRVGKNAPVGFNTYVQKTGDSKVLLAASAFRSGMDKQVKDLRDKTIVNFADGDVQKVHIAGENKDITLIQKDGVWRIEKPADYAADAAAVRSFLSTLKSMRAVDFPAEQPTDLGTYGLDTPRLTVTLFLGKDNTEKRVLLGKETGNKNEIYVSQSGQPTVYSVSDWVFRDLNKNLGDLRDKTVLAFERDKVGLIELARKDGSVKLTRGEDKKWHVDGNEGKVAESTVNQYLGDLHDLKGFEIAADNPTDLASFGLDQPELKIVLSGDDKQPIGTILLGQRQAAEGKTERTAMPAGGPTVFVVRDFQVTRLNKKADDFLEKPAAAGATPVPQVGTGGELEDDVGEFEDEPAEEMDD